MFTFPRRCERPELGRGRRTGMEPGSQTENGRGVPQTDRQTGNRQAYRNKWRANKMKHRNQDQIMTDVGLLERRRAKAETSTNHKRRNEKRQKPFSTHQRHSSCGPKKTEVQKEAMDLSQKEHWVDEHPRPGAPPP